MRQILPTLDLRTQAQRQGITRTQQTVQAIANILQTVGLAEQQRRNRQTLDRITRAISGGANTIEAIAAAAEQRPEFSTGIPGVLQKIGGAFQPSGGMGQAIQQAIIGQTIESEYKEPTPLRPISTGDVTSVFDPSTGQIIPTKHPSARVPSTSVTVQTGAVEKSTRGQIEKDVIDLQTTLGELNQINEDYNEDFFTYRGRGKAYFTALAEKAEVPVSKAAKDFLSQKTKFFADAKRVFLKFRKFITGVAGGIEEFKEIAKATIDPESDSPTQFKAKMTSMRDNAVRVSNLLLAIRNSGLDDKDKTVFKDALSLVPFDSIPLEVNENITLESLIQEPKGKSKTDIPDDIKAMSDEELKRLAGIE